MGDEEQKDQILAHNKKCAKETKVLQKTVMHNGVYYKKVGGKWRYYGKSLTGRGKGWSFVHGYWFYDGYAYTKLEAIPKDPHGKFRVEAPTKPYWPKKNTTKKVVKNATKKVVKNAPKVNKVVKTSVKKT